MSLGPKHKMFVVSCLHMGHGTCRLWTFLLAHSLMHLVWKTCPHGPNL